MIFQNCIRLAIIWYTIGRPGRIERIFPSTIRRRAVYGMYTSRSDFGIPNDNHWSTKKSGKSFHTYHESTNIFHKNKRRKSGENLKSEQYIAIFHDILE